MNNSEYSNLKYPMACQDCGGTGIEPATRQVCSVCRGKGQHNHCYLADAMPRETPRISHENLRDDLDILHAAVVRLKARVLPRVEYQVPMTDSGIQLTGGATTVTKIGVIIGVVPIHNGVTQAFGALVKEEGQAHIALVDIGMCKFLDGD